MKPNKDHCALYQYEIPLTSIHDSYNFICRLLIFINVINIHIFDYPDS